MSHLTILKKNEVYLQIESDPHVFYELSDQFTFELPGAKFMPQYRKRYWDGKIRLFNINNGQIYVGLLDKIQKFCEDHGYSYSFVDNEFLSRDSIAFRAHVASIMPDVDMTSTFTDADGNEKEFTVPMTVTFLWPNAGI